MTRRLAAEFLSSMLPATLVIGSGIAAQRLSPGDVGLQLLENAAATAARLCALILIFGPISGAHFNPAVSLADAAFGGLTSREALSYVPAQVIGCISARCLRMSCSKLRRSTSATERATAAHGVSEVVATVALLLVTFSLARSGRGERAPAAVGAYIGAAYFFTSSTSFTNPAITIGRTFSDTFVGIAPSSVPAFVAAQLVGGANRHRHAAGALPEPGHQRRRRGAPHPTQLKGQS